MWQRALRTLWLVPVTLLLAAGCGGSDVEMDSVSGTVKFADGSVPQGEMAVVRFEPVVGSDAQIRKGASGEIQADGSFEMMTVMPGDGVIAGKYKVCFTIYETYLGQESLIPEKYTKTETTPFEVTVGSGSDDQFDFDLEKL